MIRAPPYNKAGVKYEPTLPILCNPLIHSTQTISYLLCLLRLKRHISPLHNSLPKVFGVPVSIYLPVLGLGVLFQLLIIRKTEFVLRGLLLLFFSIYRYAEY